MGCKRRARVCTMTAHCSIDVALLNVYIGKLLRIVAPRTPNKWISFTRQTGRFDVHQTRTPGASCEKVDDQTSARARDIGVLISPAAFSGEASLKDFKPIVDC